MVELRKPVAEPLATYGGAFGTGILLGWVATTRPTWATGISVLAGAAGVIGSLTLKGFLADISEGLGAAAMGALGSSVPALLGAGTARRIAGQPNPKQLNAGRTNLVGDTIAKQFAKSSLEF